MNPRRWISPSGWALVLGLVSATAQADRVDDLVLAQLAKQNIPGASVAVLKNGRVLKIKGYGVANLELGDPVTPETVFQIGSVSKQFLAAAVVLLARDGRLGIDDPIHKFLPDAPETWRPITLRHLLTHTSGLMREVTGLEGSTQPIIDTVRARLRAAAGVQAWRQTAVQQLRLFHAVRSDQQGGRQALA
jgi:CubicO group peptidase (beta-lactamase class C family)